MDAKYLAEIKAIVFAYESALKTNKNLVAARTSMERYAYTGFKALIAEVERLQRQVDEQTKIAKRKICIKQAAIDRLYGENSTLEKALDDEKCALLKACEFISEEFICCEDSTFYCCKGCEPNEDCALHLLNYFIQQAQEQEADHAK